MRGSQLSVALAALALCACSPPDKPPNNVASTTAPPLERASGAGHALLCKPRFPEYGTYRLERGYATGDTEAEARRAAEEDARSRLLHTLASAVSPAERSQLARAISTTWQSPVAWRSVSGGFEACALAIVASSGVAVRMRAASDAFDAAVMDRARKLAAALAPALAPAHASAQGALQLSLPPPSWADGSSAHELGENVHLRLRAGLLQHPALRMLDSGNEAWAAEVRSKLATAASGCMLLLEYRARKGGWQALETVKFSPIALGLTDCSSPPQTAISDGRMGLVRGERAGGQGLTVQLHAPTRQGMLCEGEQFSITATASSPAWIAIYSIAEDGRLLFGWRSETALQRWAPKPRAVALRLASGQRYRIVAVALPASTGPRFADHGLPPPGCFSHDGFNAKRLPDEAAITTLTHGVAPAGQGWCPNDPATRRRSEELSQALGKLGRCSDKRPDVARLSRE